MPGGAEGEGGGGGGGGVKNEEVNGEIPCLGCYLTGIGRSGAQRFPRPDGSMTSHQGGGAAWCGDDSDDEHVLDRWIVMTFRLFLRRAMRGRQIAPMCFFLFCGLPVNI